MSHNISATPSADLLRRLAGLIYDAFLLFAISLGYGTVLLVLRIIIVGADQAAMANPPPFLQWLSFIGLYLALSGYYVICWRKQGQTIGMKAWRLKLQQPNGALATPAQCWQRCLAAPMSLLCLGVGYLWCLLPPAKQCLHDRYTGTQVIVLPKTN